MNPARTVLALAAAAALVTGAAPGAAAAAPDAAAIAAVGTGALNPGLPTLGCAYQSVVVNLFVTVAATVSSGPVGVVSATFDGSSVICETALDGAGAGRLTGGLIGEIAYSRRGPMVTIVGKVIVAPAGPTTYWITGGLCYFHPTSGGPVTSFALVCTAVLQP